MSAKIVMVASGKGGTGKSTVSVLAGGRLAAAGQKVLLIELDSGLRSVDIISGVYGKTVYDIEDVLCGRCSGEKAVVESPLYPGLSVISAPYEGGEVQTQALQALCAKMREYFDFLLIDTAAGMGAPFRAAAACAQQALLVLGADPVSLRDGRIVSDALYDGGLHDIRLVLNKVAPASFQNGLVRDVDECIDTVCAQLIAVIPESREVQFAAAKGEALPAGCLAFTALDNLARRLLGKRVLLAVH
ncbi:MAG: AAA family ATPase [Faecalibacterium sp.]|nr:AAA family ATPase [Faecalibacterium sp.]